MVKIFKSKYDDAITLYNMANVHYTEICHLIGDCMVQLYGDKLDFWASLFVKLFQGCCLGKGEQWHSYKENKEIKT